MYGVGCSQTILRDSNHQFSAAFKHHDDEEFTKNGDSSNRLQDQPSSGLMRFRSAPSSFFASLLDSNGGAEACCEDFLNSNESDAIFAGFMATDNSLELQFPVTVKNEAAISKPPLPQQNGYSKTGSRKTTSRLNSGNSGFSRLDGISKMKSNLVRQSSSPTGLFSNLSGENGFALMKDMRSTSFSSGPSSSSRFMPQIAENGNEGSSPTTNTENEQMGNDDHDKNSYYVPGRLDDAWDNSTTRLTGIKRSRDDDREKLSGSYSILNQHDDEARKYSTSLTHHLSLPKTYAEMEVVEKFLHFQHDSVPCKIRAKRGCATHPRSIAERMRRTRISERMRKLQELFPNMDKQTNTADMLELAVRYIKDLQNQVQTLTEKREKCTCCVGEKMVYN